MLAAFGGCRCEQGPPDLTNTLIPRWHKHAWAAAQIMLIYTITITRLDDSIHSSPIYPNLAQLLCATTDHHHHHLRHHHHLGSCGQRRRGSSPAGLSLYSRLCRTWDCCRCCCSHCRGSRHAYLPRLVALRGQTQAGHCCGRDQVLC